MIPLELIKLMHNLKDRDFDVNGPYKVDENEAQRLIEAIELMATKGKEVLE